MTRYAGVDVGTSGLKISVLDERGTIVEEHEARYRASRPHPGWDEIDPDEWLAAYRNCAVDDVDAIGFTGQMHGVVVTDAAGVPLRPAVLWRDSRAAGLLRQWATAYPDVLARLDVQPSPGYAGAILAWLNKYEPDVMGRAERVWFAKDWLRGQVAEREDAVTDRSDASASLLWDPVADEWLGDAVAVAGLTRSQLPEVVVSTEVVGRSGTAAVVVGGADTATALDAYRSIAAPREGTVYVNIGTGVQVVRPSVSRPRRAVESTRVFADTSGGWYAMQALVRADAGSRGVLLDRIVESVRTLGGTDVVVGGGAAHDPGFRRALAVRCDRMIRYAPPRSLSACGAAMLAARGRGHRIELRQDAVEVISDGSDR